ncbi:MAG TPA: ArsA-related P-loop ATPase [Polyangia bacterium]|jgi:anion-transporting  ArsA/GET3 family ATPase
MNQTGLANLVAERRILVCVGSGGVGKTTTAASLGLAGARAGRRTLVLTIDPARRLANALGLDSLGHDEQPVPPEKVALGGAHVAGTLHAMMLDQKRAFDEIVARYAPDAETRQRIFDNRIYREISTRLAGSHEYAAMSKLYEIASEGRYDLIVLDTPPTENALDFLEAPERVSAAVDSPAISWLVKPYLAAGRFSLKAVGMGAAFVLRRLARFVGSDFLEDMARFFVEFHSILVGFRERAQQVFEILRQPDVGFVLVSSPEPMSIDEAIYFHDRLVASEMPLGGFVVNRVHQGGPEAIGREALIAKLTARPELRGYSPDDVVQVAADFERTYRELQALAAFDAREVGRLRERSSGRAPLVEVPFFDHDIYDVEGLSTMVRYLVG